jgi:outer membrane lipoprotein-sorting protein
MVVKFIKNPYLIFFLAILLAMPIYSMESDSNFKTLISLLSSSKYISAEFKLDIYDETEQLKDSSSGFFKLLRPDFLMTETLKPYEQILSLNDKKFLQYDIDMEQLIIKEKPNELVELSNLLLLNDLELLKKTFFVKSSKSLNKKIIFDVELRSPRSTMKNIRLSFLNKILSNMIIFDNFGTSMVLTLDKVNIETPISRKDFEIETTEETEIIYQ